MIVDGLTYLLDYDSLQVVTGGLPSKIMTQFWLDLNEYSAGLWSVWEYVYGTIQTKGANAEVYIIFAMCDDKYSNEIWYMASKGIAKPK
ncbi:hypothetical protein TREPR_1433 [Treponema primitia ZAS-2]|uniref:Uncharacterized protein n=1 Tax=Treponema primitia (strain ATCC BAA-887 / DSM 12427 / ZAS-2) TaxID=545694 RepID=F5YQ64_TREPZ|nr:hypothetical protein TREPR_1433 [Treponema primitia ZAS-2]